MGLLVDSTVLINLERRGLSPDMLRQGSTEEWAVSAVTMSEVLFGLERARTAQQRSDRQDFIEMILAIYPVLPFDISAARTYARTWADSSTLGNESARMTS